MDTAMDTAPRAAAPYARVKQFLKTGWPPAAGGRAR
jgi:hypothetical protein